VECLKALGQNVMSHAEMRFLNSFTKVMKPVVIAMRMLEGETDCYMGQLIPTVMGLEKKLQTLSEDDVIMRPLTEAILNGLKDRFDQVMKSDEYRTAAMLHPKFKLAFVPEEEHLHCHEMLLSYLQKVKREIQLSQSVMASGSNSSLADNADDHDDDDLYSFLQKSDHLDTSVADQVIML